MTERITHDHPTIETRTATIGRIGGTTRPEVRIEPGLGLETGQVVRLVLDGSEYRVLIEQSGGRTVLRGAYDTPRMARSPGTGTNHLERWVADRSLDPGRTVHLDVVEEGFKYGLRGPGESATYTTGRPDSGLADIADTFGLD